MSDVTLPIVKGSFVFRATRPERIGEVLDRIGVVTARVRWSDGEEEGCDANYLTASRTFAWKRWSGGSDTIQGVLRVEFGPRHVIFYGPEDLILRAERIEQINELRETTIRSMW